MSAERMIEPPLTAPGEVAAQTSAIAVLDAGGQYVDLVKKGIERQGFEAVVLPIDTPLDEIEKTYSAIVMSGSPASSHAETAPQPDEALWKTKLPFLGICYGQQAMAQAFGGTVETGVLREDGRVTTQVDTTQPIFQGLKKDLTGLFTHGDFVTKVPNGFTAIGTHEIGSGEDKKTVYSALAKDNFIGVQFHPEVFDDTPAGYEIFSNFLQKVAKLTPDQELLEKQTEGMIADMREDIRAKADGREVIAFASGGIDSTVATLLAAEVIDPAKLHIFYIDNGFMRDEDAAVIEMLKENGINVQQYDAVEEFEEATFTENGVTEGPLKDVTNPETKRRIIGEMFVTVRDKLAQKLNLTADEAMLLQGTNAADRIESGHSKGGQATDVIKTHHNQVKGVKDLEARGLLIEPLDELFKDEIRRVGEVLGLPEDVVWRQPFPGPGLAIRILGAKPGEYEPNQPEVQSNISEFLSEQAPDLTNQLLPVRSVGVGGDARSHISAVALQGDANWDELAKLATDLPGNFRSSVNRVVYALGDAPLQNMSITPTDLSAETRTQLKQADRIVFELMREHQLIKNIRQCPVVLLPLSFGEEGGRSIVLRPVTTSTWLTVQAMLPERDLPVAFTTQATARILDEVPGITQVFLDLTNKPPGTTEWE